MKGIKVSNTDIDVLEDAKPAGSEDLLQKIYDYADKMLAVGTRIEKGVILLKELGDDYKEIETHILPELMAEAGMKEFTTEAGKFKIKDILKASLPSKGAIDKAKGEERDKLEDRLARALVWLREHEAESLIKNIISADVGKDNEIADKIVKFLTKIKAVYKRDENVNGNTLSSYIKEQIGAGVEIDFELFGVFSGKQVKVTKAKK